VLLHERRIWIGSALLIAAGVPARVDAQGQPEGCNARLASPSMTVALPGNPFAVKASADGCWVFVSVDGANRGIAVLKRGYGRMDMVRVVPVTPAPAGIVLTHDGKLLIAAANNSAVVLDAGRMTTGAKLPIVGKFSGFDRGFLGSVYVNVTADDKLLFVSQEAAQAITVIDLELARQNGYKPAAIVGNIPVGAAPIALTFSLDGKWLYTTSEGAAPQWNWPRACKPEGAPPQTPEQIAARKADAEHQIAALQAKQSSASDKGAAQLQEEIDSLKAFLSSPSSPRLVNPEGAVVVVDVGQARNRPVDSVAGRIPAGCSAVRMAISPDGRRIYVTARNSNAVEVFDTSKLLSDPDHARVGVAPVGEAPVPVAVIDEGKKVVAGNSNRFAGGNAPQTLTVLDAAKMEQKGADASLGTIRAGAFPRELSVSADGHTLFLTNAGSSSLQVIDIDRLPVESARVPR
jgi:DNA-binding beta-propeller fold protein YncE